jgi:hypothetical protein
MSYIREHTDCITNWNPRARGRERDDDQPHAHLLASAHPVPVDRTVTREGKTTRTTEVLHTPAGDLRRVFEKHDDVLTTWQVEHPCKDLADVDRALSVPFEPFTHDASDLSRVLDELGGSTTGAPHGLVLASQGDPALIAADLMSFQDFTLWAYADTEHFGRAVEIVAERVMENLERELATCVVDMYRIVGPEYFTPPYLPPSLFRRFVVPHVTAMTDLMHRYGAKVRLHCHGRIARVLDMILATGCDAIDPCEPPPDGDIELAECKRRCASAGVCVFGNTELKLLEQGSPEQVRAHVDKAMEDAREGGGFVLLPTAAPINVPLSPRTEANYMTWIDAALEFGRY